MEKNAAAQTLTERCAGELTEYIRKNGIRPGEKLPTETELEEILSAGRNTVREALRMLVSRNILTIRQGSGIYVSEKTGVADDPFGFSLVTDRERLTRELLQIRVILEPPIAALAAENAEEKEIRELRRILERLEKIILAGNVKDYSVWDTDFHVQIARCTHNAVMGNLLPVISAGVDVFAKEVAEAEYRQTLVSHRKIYEAIRDRKPEEAKDQMLYHLLYNRYRFDAEKEEQNHGINLKTAKT